ncbi:hypothetical protein QAD02_000733 [Eretmocerus hayati]|uniref:Uncharacterized protein n=1 Tax=Eretmocerus hayati TaxID=131215 RepID=A0ACC2NE11_9HYME|nr:hypothetical protein QAD02_000733 [Eretmocerus hayati]
MRIASLLGVSLADILGLRSWLVVLVLVVWFSRERELKLNSEWLPHKFRLTRNLIEDNYVFVIQVFGLSVANLGSNDEFLLDVNSSPLDLQKNLSFNECLLVIWMGEKVMGSKSLDK